MGLQERDKIEVIRAADVEDDLIGRDDRGGFGDEGGTSRGEGELLFTVHVSKFYKIEK